MYEVSVDLKSNSDAIGSFTEQMDTVTEGMLELNTKLKAQGESLVNHEKTIAVAEHRIKQANSEVDEKLTKYDDVIVNVQRISTTITDELETIQKQVSVNKKEESIARAELHDLLNSELEQVKVDLVTKQKNETTEIAKHIFKMEKEKKNAEALIQTNSEELTNIRGKVELVKDQAEKFSKKFITVDDELSRRQGQLSALETKIDQVRSALQAQQTSALDGASVAEQLIADKSSLEQQLEKATEREEEARRATERLKVRLVALEDELTTTKNIIEELENDKFSPQKMRELIAEETAELHEIIDETCGKVNQLENDRSEDNKGIIKQAEKANRAAELLLEREESTKAELESQIVKTKKQLETVRDEITTEMSGFRDKMRDDDRAFDDLKFELEQRLKDMEGSIKSLAESIEGTHIFCSFFTKIIFSETNEKWTIRGNSKS